MQDFFLLFLFIIALYYLYRKLFKNRGCGCKKAGCAAPLPHPPKKKESD